MHWYVHNEQISLARNYIVKHVLGQQAVSLLHFIFEKGIETILSSTCIVGEFRITVLLEFWTLLILVQPYEGKLICYLIECLCMPLLYDPSVFAFPVKHDHNCHSKPS